MIGILIDSSNEKLLIGIAKDEKIIDKVDEEAWLRQSELLVDYLDKLLDKNQIKREDISYVVASKGPGSYTGVRIALTVAKVMAIALNIPLYLVSSLELLKDNNAISVCVSNARSKRSYVGVYDKEKSLLEDTIFANEELIKYLSEHPNYKLCGNVSYLNLEGYKADVIENLFLSKNEKNLVSNPLSAKPVYLKDNY